MNDNLQKIAKEIAETKAKIKELQHKILVKTAEMDKLSKKNSLIEQKSKKPIELDINNFTKYDITGMGQEAVETLYLKKKSIESLEKDYKSIKNECDNRKKIVDECKFEGLSTTKRLNLNSTNSCSKTIKSSAQIEKSYEKIRQLDKNIENKTFAVRNLQAKLSKITFSQYKTKDGENPENAMLLNEIKQKIIDIEIVDKNIEELKLQMKYLQKPEEIPIDVSTIDKYEANDIQEQILSMKDELQTIEKRISKSERQSEKILRNIEKLDEYYQFLQKVPRITAYNSSKKENDKLSVEELVEKIKSSKTTKNQNSNEIKLAIIKTKQEIKALEAKIEQKQRVLGSNFQILRKDKINAKQKIVKAQKTIKDNENK